MHLLLDKERKGEGEQDKTMELNEMIDFLKDCQLTHNKWAGYFERDPEMECVYVGSGKWDDAATHRQIEGKYEEIIQHLKNHQPEDSSNFCQCNEPDNDMVPYGKHCLNCGKVIRTVTPKGGMMKIYIDCRCGCSILRIQKELESDEHNSAIFYFNMYRSLNRCGLFTRIKQAWEYFRSGEFAYSDIVVETEDIDRMIKFLKTAQNDVPIK